MYIGHGLAPNHQLTCLVTLCAWYVITWEIIGKYCFPLEKMNYFGLKWKCLFFLPKVSENMINKSNTDIGTGQWEMPTPHQYLTRNVFTNFLYSTAISAVILSDTPILSKTAIKVTGTVNVYDDGRRWQWHGTHLRHPVAFRSTCEECSCIFRSSWRGEFSQPEWGMITALVNTARVSWMIGILRASQEERFQRTPARQTQTELLDGHCFLSSQNGFP